MSSRTFGKIFRANLQLNGPSGSYPLIPARNLRLWVIFNCFSRRYCRCIQVYSSWSRLLNFNSGTLCVWYTECSTWLTVNTTTRWVFVNLKSPIFWKVFLILRLSLILTETRIFLATRTSMLFTFDFGSWILTTIFSWVGRSYRSIRVILFRERLLREYFLSRWRNFNTRRRWVLAISCGSLSACRTRRLSKVLSIGSR